MPDDDDLQMVFRCAPEYAGILPPPIPAVQGLPEWFKAMPQYNFNDFAQKESQTLKRCPPFIDAMTYGYLFPLVCDLKVDKGEFSWDFDLPASFGGWRSPISFHDGSQAVGSPFFRDDRFIVKFHNFWTVEVPPGYSLLFTHPVNRADLPFTAVTGLVDADRYRDNYVHFPALWHDMNFTGVLPKGTPVAQCIPVKRHSWSHRVEALTPEQARRIAELSGSLKRETGVYRRQFRVSKR
jgi:hypothetical protein